MVSLIGLIEKARNYFLDKKRIRIRESLPHYSTPIDLANIYNNGATREQKEYIDWVLEKYSDRFKKETRYFIDALKQSQNDNNKPHSG
ncbi:MAG: hypothetical protein WD876_00635 [Candidatus Pacearchaeota archaeon]